MSDEKNESPKEVNRERLHFSSESQFIGDDQVFTMKREYEDNAKHEEITVVMHFVLPQQGEEGGRKLGRIEVDYWLRGNNTKGREYRVSANVVWDAKDEAGKVVVSEYINEADASKSLNAAVEITPFDPFAVSVALDACGSARDLYAFLSVYLPRQFMLTRPRFS